MLQSWFIFGGLIGFPFFVFLGFSLLYLFYIKISESALATSCRIVMFFHFLTCVYVGWQLLFDASHMMSIELGQWYFIGDYQFDLIMIIDQFSYPLIVCASFLLNVVVYFCIKYLHRDHGYFRFCMLYLLFSSGISLVLLAGTVDLLFAGWEMLGLSSALLIGYYHDRPEPARNGLIAFSYYRFCDVALLTGAVLLHHIADTSLIPVAFSNLPNLSYTSASTHHITLLMAMMFVVASLAKSAQFPLQSWLPRAMEGPTPSSAIFYGALSIHAGAYLLLRLSPVLEQFAAIRLTIGCIGFATWIFGSFIGRTRSDIKTFLAYASMSQVGLIYVEIALGWYKLATFHIVAHALLRALQFLRTPNILHDFHAFGYEPILGPHSRIERILPDSVRTWFYRQALLGGNVDVMFRYIVGRILAIFNRWISNHGEMKITSPIDKGDK